MPTAVLVPPLGQTVDTLTLVQWLKNEGDSVRQGEPLFVVETDKASLEIEAPATGVLRRITARAGEEVAVLSTIAEIDEAGEGKTKDGGQERAARILISPRARRLAEQEGAPMAAITPTGPEGAIIERDVRAYLSQRPAPAPAARAAPPPITPIAKKVAEEAGVTWQDLAGTGPGGRVTRDDVEQALAGQSASTPPVQSQSVEASKAIPMAGVRGVIANRMVQSHTQTAPVTLTTETDATALVALRRQLAADGVDVSYNDLLLRVLARVLAEHPALNASLQGDEIRLWQRIDVGVAVDTERGLLVPVVRGVDRKGLVELAAVTKAMAQRARDGKCTPDELTGGTFTLTNLGMYGIDAFTPIINLPECAILGVGRIQRRPVMDGDIVVGRDQVWLSLTFDHRLVDGGGAARFLQRIAQLVEKPHLLLT